MKKTCLSLIALFAALQFSYAQWTTSGNNTIHSNSGNVGIGTTNPVNKLQIGSIGATGYSGNSIVSGDGTNVVALHYGPTAYLVANGNLALGGATNFSNQLFLSSSGNVGIGTASPQRKLDLSNSGQLTFGDDVVTSSNNGVFWHSGDHYGIYRTAGPWTSNTFQQLRLQFDTGIQLAPGPDVNTGYDKSFVEVVTGKGLMVSSGNVGIGTTDTKGYKLAVNGPAIATSMKVKLQANWPDFVFLKNYKLATLTEVKTYIDKNQHLPEIPSADEVHKNGLDLGEMNRLLLKKVEELTLYLIEENRNKTQQDADISQLKRRIQLLEKALLNSQK